jgi:hypothetical protein
MSFLSLPPDIVHHILSYTGALKLRNGKYMGQISPTDKRYELLCNLPKMTLKQSGVPFSSPGEMMYIFHVSFTNKEHEMEVIVNEYKSQCRRVTVVYHNNLHLGRTIRRYFQR